jgi:hypothetical protein
MASVLCTVDANSSFGTITPVGGTFSLSGNTLSWNYTTLADGAAGVHASAHPRRETSLKRSRIEA